MLAERLASDVALQGQAFNFSYEVQVSVLDMVELILRKMKSSLRPEVLDQASNEIRYQYLSSERARTVLNWRARSSRSSLALIAPSRGTTSS
jgi:CDP-glucose 4,6-dehydratase